MAPIDPQPLDDVTRRALAGVTTATLTTVLLKKGLRNVWIRGERPRAADPDVAQALLQEHRRQGGGGDAGERAPGHVVERLGIDWSHGGRIRRPRAVPALDAEVRDLHRRCEQL